MSSRIGEPSDPFEDEGLASPDPGLAGKRITGDPQDDFPVPGECEERIANQACCCLVRL